MVAIKQAVKQGKTAHTAKVASPNSVKLDSRKVNYEQRDLALRKGTAICYQQPPYEYKLKER